MTAHDHEHFVKRVTSLAEQAAAWEDQQCHVCTCRTCGVVNARLRGALVARGWSQSAVHHVTVEGYDFRGTADPYLAVVKIGGEELHRAYDDLNELLSEEALEKVEGALRRHGC